jgi:hypothetical protein
VASVDVVVSVPASLIVEVSAPQPKQVISTVLIGPKGDQGDPGPAGSTGATGATGLTGATGPQGDPGVGVPPGGDTDFLLTKATSDDYDAQWVGPDTIVNSSSVDAAMQSGGAYPNRFDAVQPNANCIWYPPSGGVFKITVP